MKPDYPKKGPPNLSGGLVKGSNQYLTYSADVPFSTSSIPTETLEGLDAYIRKGAI